MSTAPARPPAKKAPWLPRMWQGCDLFAWIRLLVLGRFAVQPGYLYIAVIDTIASFVNVLLRFVQEAIFGRALRTTRFVEPPLFLLGHWRTGTTLLHDLMICDERFGFPTTYQCFCPCHFLLTEKWLARWLTFLIPAERPMDKMKMGFDRPQEDEFALALLTGNGSPYNDWAFPNRPPRCDKYLDLADLSASKVRRWKRTLKHFLKSVAYRAGKRLVLKSPPHTARIPVLKQMFPGALFVHIVRDPYVVYPSTVKLWRTFLDQQGFQKPTYAGLEERVLATYLRMMDRLEAGKAQLPPGQFYELRYEDLVRDPAGEMRKLYDHFALGGFERFLPRLQAYLATLQGYETNRYQLTPAERATVTARWGDVARRYGYAEPG